MTKLGKLALHGTIWTFVGYGTGQLLRLASNLILTRLLVPEMFGLMALVQTFITGLSLFSDIGIRPSIVRSTRGDDPEFLNTAWTLQVIRGVVIWLCSFLVALPVSQFYDDRRLLWLIPVVGLTVAIKGLSSTSLATLNRKVAVGKLTIFELGIQTITLSVMIAWAFVRQTIWALVGGNIISSILRVIWSYRIESGISNCFAWDKKALRELTVFGRWIFVSTAMTFLAQQADRLILGRLLSLEMLGIYTVAFTFANIPSAIMGQLNNNVIFPVVSKRAGLPREDLREKILQKRWPLLIGLAIGVVILSSFGDLLVHSLYDSRYADAGWMLSILALGIWPFALSQAINSSLLAIGKPIYAACGYLLKFLYMLIALPFALSHMGILGAIVAIALNDLPFYLAVSFGAHRERLATIVQDLQATFFCLALIILICVCRYALGFGLPIEGVSTTL
jgi:O-antigen/teichoic acid export membrane protein